MTLREQIAEIAKRRVGVPFESAVQFPLLVTSLAAKAFIESWDFGDEREMRDARVVRHACRLLERPGQPWVADDEPGVI